MSVARRQYSKLIRQFLELWVGGEQLETCRCNMLCLETITLFDIQLDEFHHRRRIERVLIQNGQVGVYCHSGFALTHSPSSFGLLPSYYPLDGSIEDGDFGRLLVAIRYHFCKSDVVVRQVWFTKVLGRPLEGLYRLLESCWGHLHV